VLVEKQHLRIAEDLQEVGDAAGVGRVERRQLVTERSQRCAAERGCDESGQFNDPQAGELPPEL